MSKQAIPLKTPEDPEFKNSMTVFMMREAQLAFEARLQVPLRRVNEVVGLTNSRLANFGNEALRMSVYGLQGCTAMAVISEKGAWLAHIWEDPAMRHVGNLERYALSVIREGDDTIDPATGKWWVPKLRDLVRPGEIFHPDFKPRVLFLSPGDPNMGEDASSGSSAALIKIDGGIRFPFQLGKLDNELRYFLTADEPMIAGYDVTYLGVDDDREKFTALGKLLIQYTPAQTISPDGKQKAMIRVYAFDNPDDILTISFDAHPDQML